MNKKYKTINIDLTKYHLVDEPNQWEGDVYFETDGVDLFLNVRSDHGGSTPEIRISELWRLLNEMPIEIMENE